MSQFSVITHEISFLSATDTTKQFGLSTLTLPLRDPQRIDSLENQLTPVQFVAFRLFDDRFGQRTSIESTYEIGPITKRDAIPIDHTWHCFLLDAVHRLIRLGDDGRSNVALLENLGRFRVGIEKEQRTETDYEAIEEPYREHAGTIPNVPTLSQFDSRGVWSKSDL